MAVVVVVVGLRLQTYRTLVPYFQQTLVHLAVGFELGDRFGKKVAGCSVGMMAACSATEHPLEQCLEEIDHLSEERLEGTDRSLGNQTFQLPVEETARSLEECL